MDPFFMRLFLLRQKKRNNIKKNQNDFGRFETRSTMKFVHPLTTGPMDQRGQFHDIGCEKSIYIL
jgi:hypothetical protein